MPNDVVVADADIVVNPRSTNVAVPAGAPGVRVVIWTTDDVLVTFWSFAIRACT